MKRLNLKINRWRIEHLNLFIAVFRMLSFRLFIVFLLKEGGEGREEEREGVCVWVEVEVKGFWHNKN